jgi:hypothetical protein
MSRLRVVPPSVARHKIRDIGSALRGRRRRDQNRSDPNRCGKVIDLRAYTGRNVIRFPRPDGPTSVA